MSVFILALLYCFPVIPTVALPLPTSLLLHSPGPHSLNCRENCATRAFSYMQVCWHAKWYVVIRRITHARLFNAACFWDKYLLIIERVNWFSFRILSPLVNTESILWLTLTQRDCQILAKHLPLETMQELLNVVTISCQPPEHCENVL